MRLDCQKRGQDKRGLVHRRLTFDMSGVTRQAKPAVARPLDGGVRRHVATSAWVVGQPNSWC